MSIFEDKQHIHIIGAGGIGLSAVAKLLHHEGKTVTGADRQDSETLEELVVLGIPVEIGDNVGELPEDTDVVLYSGAVPEDDAQRKEAHKKKILQMSYFDFIGEYSKTKRTIAVSGTNGKSTTTAMLAMCLIEAGLDPTVIVGSKVPSWPDKNLRIGKSDLFVVEACEHEANMLKLFPQMIVLTNIEEDHLDFYRDLVHIRETFQEYVNRLPPDGQLIINADDHVSFHEIEPPTAFITYGIDNPADYIARDVQIADGKQWFHVEHMTGLSDEHADIELAQPGKFNVENALAATTAAMELGASPQDVQRGFENYHGIWRRFEEVGEFNGAKIISDYGHHPTAVHETLAGVKAFYPDNRIVLAFQPHQHNRTKKLFQEFVAAYDGAGLLIIQEIFDVAGRKEDEDADMSSREIVVAVQDRDAEHGVERLVMYSANNKETLELLSSLVYEGDIVLIMGAGDIYLIAEKLIT